MQFRKSHRRVSSQESQRTIATTASSLSNKVVSKVKHLVHRFESLEKSPRPLKTHRISSKPSTLLVAIEHLKTPNGTVDPAVIPVISHDGAHDGANKNERSQPGKPLLAAPILLTNATSAYSPVRIVAQSPAGLDDDVHKSIAPVASLPKGLASDTDVKYQARRVFSARISPVLKSTAISKVDQFRQIFASQHEDSKSSTKIHQMLNDKSLQATPKASVRPNSSASRKPAGKTSYGPLSYSQKIGPNSRQVKLETRILTNTRIEPTMVQGKYPQDAEARTKVQPSRSMISSLISKFNDPVFTNKVIIEKGFKLPPGVMIKSAVSPRKPHAAVGRISKPAVDEHVKPVEITKSNPSNHAVVLPAGYLSRNTSTSCLIKAPQQTKHDGATVISDSILSSVSANKSQDNMEKIASQFLEYTKTLALYEEHLAAASNSMNSAKAIMQNFEKPNESSTRLHVPTQSGVIISVNAKTSNDSKSQKPYLKASVSFKSQENTAVDFEIHNDYPKPTEDFRQNPKTEDESSCKDSLEDQKESCVLKVHGQASQRAESKRVRSLRRARQYSQSTEHTLTKHAWTKPAGSVHGLKPAVSMPNVGSLKLPVEPKLVGQIRDTKAVCENGATDEKPLTSHEPVTPTKPVRCQDIFYTPAEQPTKYRSYLYETPRSHGQRGGDVFYTPQSRPLGEKDLRTRNTNHPDLDGTPTRTALSSKKEAPRVHVLTEDEASGSHDRAKFETINNSESDKENSSPQEGQETRDITKTSEELESSPESLSPTGPAVVENSATETSTSATPNGMGDCSSHGQRIRCSSDSSACSSQFEGDYAAWNVPLDAGDITLENFADLVIGRGNYPEVDEQTLNTRMQVPILGRPPRKMFSPRPGLHLNMIKDIRHLVFAWSDGDEPFVCRASPDGKPRRNATA